MMNMNNTINLAEESSHDEIDVIELFKLLISGKWLIFGITSLFFLLSLIYSLSLPNIYISKAILVPQHSSIENNSNYGSLANFAGFNIANQPASTLTSQATEKLNSFSFFENNILPKISLPELMAVDRWDQKTNKIIFNSKIFNESGNSWLKEGKQENSKPSLQDSYKLFKSHLSIKKNQETGFITLEISHQSPFIAKEWVMLLVDEVNLFYRDKEKLEAEQSVQYINEQMLKTNLAEIKLVLSNLLQQEIQKLLLIEVNKSYVFEYLDPPVAMEKKSEPSRSFICLIGLIVGLIMGVTMVILQSIYRNINLTK